MVFQYILVAIGILSPLVTYIVFHIGRNPIISFGTKIDEVKNEFKMEIINNGGPAKVIDYYIDFNNKLYRKKDFNSLYSDLLTLAKNYTKKHNLQVGNFRQNWIILGSDDTTILMADSKNLLLQINGIPLGHLLRIIKELKLVITYKSTLPLGFKQVKVQRLKYNN